jgi:hypothetical protein
LAVRLSRCPTLTRGRLAAEVDKLVAALDRDAVRRTHEAVRDRFVDVDTADTGMAFVTGTVLATAGQALDRRLQELAATVCEADPRTRAQRRADALGALAAGADRLACGCGSADCPAAATVSAPNLVIHVVADQATVEGHGTTPGVVGRRGSDPGPDGGRAGRERAAATADPAAGCARTALHRLRRARRLRAVPRSDVSGPGL